MDKKKAQLKNAVHKNDGDTAPTVAVWLQDFNNCGCNTIDRFLSRDKRVYSFRSHAKLEVLFNQLLKTNNMDAFNAPIDGMRQR